MPHNPDVPHGGKRQRRRIAAVSRAIEDGTIDVENLVPSESLRHYTFNVEETTGDVLPTIVPSTASSFSAPSAPRILLALDLHNGLDGGLSGGEIPCENLAAVRKSVRAGFTPWILTY